MNKLFLLCVIIISLQSCKAQNEIHLVEGVMNTNVSEELDYYLYYPPDYSENKSKSFPILLFLHGGGESGGELNLLKKNGPPKMITDGIEFPFLILAPQNPHKKMWWNTRAVMQLLDTIVTNNRVDTSRIYLTGLSRGGSAAWNLAVQYPDKFAALAVVCGMAPAPYAHWINKDLPIRVYHGELDNVIPISQSLEMVNKLKEMGYNVELTIYKDIQHNAWEKAYSEEDLFSWFMLQSLK